MGRVPPNKDLRGLKGLRVSKGLLDLKALLNLKALKVLPVLKGNKAQRDLRGLLGLKDPWDRLAYRYGTPMSHSRFQTHQWLQH